LARFLRVGNGHGYVTVASRLILATPFNRHEDFEIYYKTVRLYAAEEKYHE
jgi:hypothetical protein